MKPGGEVIRLERHPWRRTIFATGLLVGLAIGCVVGWIACVLTKAP